MVKRMVSDAKAKGAIVQNQKKRISTPMTGQPWMQGLRSAQPSVDRSEGAFVGWALLQQQWKGDGCFLCMGQGGPIELRTTTWAPPLKRTTAVRPDTKRNSWISAIIMHVHAQTDPTLLDPSHPSWRAKKGGVTKSQFLRASLWSRTNAYCTCFRVEHLLSPVE